MQFDFAVYRATPAGIMAAVSASRLGMRTVIVEPGPYIGGMMTSGLNATDTVEKVLITGIAREFFRRAQAHYRTHYLPVRIESKIADRIFREMLDEAGVVVLRSCHIVHMQRDGRTIHSARLSDGQVLSAGWWVDASYEGDLLPLADIGFALGRESADELSEPWAGRRASAGMIPWGSKLKINPLKDGKLIDYVAPPSGAPVGSADASVQSYCIRPTLTNNPANMAPIEAPEDFDFTSFDMFRAMGSTLSKAAVTAKWHPGLGTTFKSAYFNLAELPRGKFDMNSGPLAPINNPSLTKGWVEASLEKRGEMTEAFRRYTLAVLHFIQSDDSVDYAVRKFFAGFGLPADEYAESGHFPPMVYVREGRRLKGERIFTQQSVETGGVPEADAICMSKYSLDCKPVHWRASRDMTNVVREGMFFSPDPYRYGLPTWVILPKRDECTNFFAVCAVSASHVAFGSIRMEPTWMELGSAAAMMAYLSERDAVPVHEVQGVTVRALRNERFGARDAPAVPDVVAPSRLGRIFLRK